MIKRNVSVIVVSKFCRQMINYYYWQYSSCIMIATFYFYMKIHCRKNDSKGEGNSLKNTLKGEGNSLACEHVLNLVSSSWAKGFQKPLVSESKVVNRGQ